MVSWCFSDSILANRFSRFVQIDDPNLTYFCDAEWIDIQAKEGNDLNALLDLCLKCHNDVLANLPSDLRVGVHLCRGNFAGGMYVATGAYDRIAAKMFQDLDYRLYYMEYDSDRAGDFSALQYLPVDKAAVLGVVTTKYAESEDIDLLKARVMNAAEMIARGQGRSQEDALRDNLAVSPQCGFASAADGSGVDMTEEIQWQKLELLKRLAEDVWPSEVDR